MRISRNSIQRLALYGLVAVSGALAAALPAPAMAVVYGGLEGLRISSDADPGTVASLGPPNDLVAMDPASAIRVLGGYFFIREYASVEVGYTNLGDFRSIVGLNRFDADMKAWDITGVGHYPVATILGQKISVYASVGAWSWDAAKTTRIGGAFTRTDESGTDIAYGGGLEIKLFNLALIRFNFMKLDIDAAEAGNGDMTLGGVTVGFDL